ncbi:MAG: hypothetical protein L0206_20330 [Actinobacteria bacterium]|nr:hypothetical protein [Actinomycetota bacterium]
MGERQVELTLSVSAANGSTFAWWPASDDVFGAAASPQLPVEGRIRSVKAELVSGGGWTFNALRVRIGHPIRTTQAGVAGTFDPATLASSRPTRILYDSNPLVTFTGLVLSDALVVPMPFHLPWTLGLEWGTSAGAGTATFIFAVGVD